LNSAEMEYNMSRHPELYHMDVFGVIRLNEEEYEKQQEEVEMKETITIHGTAKKEIIRGENGKERLKAVIHEIESLGFVTEVVETKGFITLEDVQNMLQKAEYRKVYNDILEA